MISRRTPLVLAAVATAALLVAASPVAAVRAVDRVEPSTLKPTVVWKRIPFGATRRRQMAAYSERHYGRRAPGG